ncbi:AraC family transcriptional regulator [Paraglaciecola sp.]
MSINDVAQVYGYPSLQYMYTVFKKHYDKTPRGFKNGLNSHSC